MGSNITRRQLLRGTSGCVVAAATSPLWANSTTIADDIDILRAAMEIHPGALRYLNPAALNAALDQLQRELTLGAGLAERYLALSRFLSTLKCGHSYANFYNQSEAVRKALFDRPTRLPFAFRWLNRQMVVTEAAPGVDLPRGSVITQVNGAQAHELLDRLLPYTRADGIAAGKRRALLEVQHRERYEFFDIFHGLVFGEPAGGTHQLRFTTPGGRSRQLDAAAISLDDRQQIRKSRQVSQDRDAPLWSFETRDGVGVLTMSDWSTYNSKWDWQSWLDARLDEAAALRGLIIDNRQNEGGNPMVGLHLLSRLINKPLSLMPYDRLVRFRTLPDILRPVARTWDPSFYSIGEKAEPIGRGFFRLPAADTIDEVIPQGTHVATPTILLTSPTNSSATFTFASLARISGRMTLVGETTGGNYRGINGDGYFFTTLPHSGIEFDIPIVGRFPRSPQPDAGITPDVVVTESIADTAAGRDTTLERALAMVGKSAA